MMECFFSFIFIMAIYVVVGMINASNERQQKKQIIDKLVKVQQEIDADLSVKYIKDKIEAEDGEKLSCHKVTISGTCRVPNDNYPCRILFCLFDSTEDGEEDKYPVLCLIPEFADENGFLQYEHEIKMPYDVTTFDDLPVIAFPPQAMILPKRGKRKVEAYVAITPLNSDRCFKHGSTVVTCTQSGYGYLEYEERSIKTNELIAQIAIAICASDGYIDKRETAIVKSFFAEQFARLNDPEKVKESVNSALKETLSAHKNNQLNIEAELVSCCKKLIDSGRKNDIHAAYELAVRIVAADEQVQDEERAALRKLAQLLEIQPDLAKEIQDKNFAVSMFAQTSRESMLDMPTGLTKEQKIKFLNKEYQKWRARVNHQNAKIRTEAEMRIQAITKLRHDLEKELDNV